MRALAAALLLSCAAAAQERAFVEVTAPKDAVRQLIDLNLVTTYGLTDFVSHAAAEALDKGYGVEEIAKLYAGRRLVFLDTIRGMNDVDFSVERVETLS